LVTDDALICDAKQPQQQGMACARDSADEIRVNHERFHAADHCCWREGEKKTAREDNETYIIK